MSNTIKTILERIFGTGFGDKKVGGSLRKRKKIEKCGFIILESRSGVLFEMFEPYWMNYFYENGFIRDSCYGNVVILTLFESETNKNIEIDHDTMKKFTEKIPREKLKDIRGMYGIDSAKIGRLYGENTLPYNVLIDSFGKIMAEGITNLKYGEIKEYKT